MKDIIVDQKEFGIVSCYPYSVAEVAWSIVKKHRRWHRKPFVKRLMMRMEAQRYSLNYSILSLPFRKDQRILIPLRYGDYQRSFLLDESLKRGSVTITESAVIIAFTKQVKTVTPVRRIGVDLNEKSAVFSDGSKVDLSEAARLHTEYGIRRSKFYETHPRDHRLAKKFAASRREKDRGLRQLKE